jgi:probable rRNA maturation factor
LEDEPPSISLFITEDSLPEAQGLNLKEIEHAAQSMLQIIDHNQSWEAGIKVVDESNMTMLHDEYMQDPTPTDVMSFEAEPEDLDAGYLGDLIVCACVAESEAKGRSHSSEDELIFYILHGLLHLLGYDDDTDEKRQIMLNIQARSMEKIGRTVEV